MSSLFARPFIAKVIVLTSLCLGLGASGLRAEIRTLTDRQGRSLKAEVVSVEDDKVTIRREDGQTFTLSLATLSDDDQQSLKDWATQQAAKPKTLPPGAITVTLSRAIFETKKSTVDVKLTTGETVKNGRSLTEDKWGYAVNLTNRTPQPIDNLRAEYRLFATVDDIQVKATVKQGLKKKEYASQIPAIKEFSQVAFRTETISAIKTHYNGNIVAAKSGESSSRETLSGIWIRIYQGEDLVYETAMPDSLRTTEKW